MEEIGKILPVVFKRHIRRADPRLVQILAPLWPRVAGKAIARQSQPVAFVTGTLTLATPCQSWATQLRQMAEEIRAEINSFLGGPVVKKLRVQLVPKLDGSEATVPQEDASSPLEVSKLHAADGWAKLDPETARILERSLAKYFARSAKRVH